MVTPRNGLRAKLHTIKKQTRISFLQVYGEITAKNRMSPDFLIIGSQRSGTTSLYNYLIRHPLILPAVLKEVHFFDLSYQKGLNWYLGNFPRMPAFPDKERRITGEASPYYIFHPHAPSRVARTFPDVKIILLLRNPVDRAYSHYQNEVKLGFEPLSFEDAIDQESARLDGEVQKLLDDENYQSFNHRHYTYLSRGIYVEQLKPWMKAFPRDQILIIKSEDFFASPQQVLDTVFKYLQVHDFQLPGFRVHNRLQYQGMDPQTRERLDAYFAPHNQALCDFLGINFGWNGTPPN